MKTDRELLELAAKAAGIKLHVWGMPGAENFADMDSEPYGKLWNPLKDDGDALRLAVQLYLDIEFLGDIDGNEVFQTTVRHWMDSKNSVEIEGADRLKITRNAIVVYAAQIGAKML